MGENDTLWTYITPEKIGARSAIICLFLNPMIFWFLGLESSVSVKSLKQDKPRLLRFSLILFYHLGNKPYLCSVIA